jgi:hypothetical protein
MVYGWGFKDDGLVFGVYGSGLRVQGLGSRVWVLCFRGQGLREYGFWFMFRV